MKRVGRLPPTFININHNTFVIVPSLLLNPHITQRFCSSSDRSHTLYIGATDIPYPVEFQIDPYRARVGPPPHVACARPNIEIQLSRLPQFITYTPLNHLSNEKRDEIRRVWKIPQAEINAMDMAFRQRGPCPRLSQETRDMIVKFWAPPNKHEEVHSEANDDSQSSVSQPTVISNQQPSTKIEV
ncbi:hypothetical protein DFH27DRAFT_644819 [Peziza echinospora]|nr:hypothetical protein DFH27DRAFT_644819 [Peziza echinospora]